LLTTASVMLQGGCNGCFLLDSWNGQRAGKVLHITVSPVGSLQGDIAVAKIVEHRSKNSDNNECK
jgi:hypothetical protein